MARGMLLVGAVAAWLIGCGDDSTPPGPSEANPLDSEEASLLTGLNEFREQNFVERLAECASLNVSASAHSDDMRDGAFVSGEGSDGSTARQRACEAGYQPACATGVFMEAVGSGGEEGYLMLRNWQDDEVTNLVLLDTNLVVAGVGRSVGEDGARWTVDLGTDSDASCD